jgi:hypothetical protein
MVNALTVVQRQAMVPVVEELSVSPNGAAIESAGVPPHWLAAARLYSQALRTGVVPGVPPIPQTAASKIVALRLDAAQLSRLADRLKQLHRTASVGDVVIVEAAGATLSDPTGITRAGLARALFEGGFDCPLIWAGRQVLRAEPPHRLLVRFLGRGTLGNAPRRLPGIATPLDADSGGLVAMARRAAPQPPDDRALRLSVVMPVYNERATFREVIDRLLAKTIPGVDIEVCIVESNSTDGTRDDVLRFADHPRVRLILEEKPLGKGHAVRAGLAAASGDFILIQDADLEYDLDDYEKLLTPLRDGTTGFVLGSRHRLGEKVWDVRQFADQPTTARAMNLGHLIFAWMLNVTFGQRMRDPFTMFKVFRRDAIHNVRFECNRFDFDLELVGKLIRQGYSPLEIDIGYNSRSFNEGKKVSVLRDPPTWVKACIKHRFSNLHAWPERG